MAENASGKAVSSNNDAEQKVYACLDCGKEYSSAPGVRYHYQNTDCSGHQCPECDADHFHTERGVKNHYGKQHEGSIYGELVNCSWCGEEKRVSLGQIRNHDNYFCDSQCKGKWIEENVGGDDHPLAKRETRECENCGTEITRCEAHFYERAFCDYDCQGEWLSENNVGENHPNWKGGVSQIVYGSGWKKAREKALERDGHACVICGVTKEEKPNRIDVHHIRPVESFDNNADAHELDNLVTLCRSHHRKWEGLPLRPHTDTIPNT